jgi:para-aminobenzoate synthetase/4-amino-4-deoxychorismate lyase
MARIAASCAWFNRPFDEAAARTLVIDACLGLPENAGLHRLRLSLGADNRLAVTTGALQPLQEPVRLVLADAPTDSSDVFLRHKTSVRSRYDAAWRAAEAQGAFDALFFNERDELTEGGRSNVFVLLEGRWYTPPLSCGLLPGVMRSVMLAAPAWDAAERVITRGMLERADGIVVCNALRGPLHAYL